MDKLDKLSLLASIILAVSTTFLVAVYADESLERDQPGLRQQIRIYTPELEKKIKVARDLLENNNLPKAAELASALMTEYPYDGGPHMILGDISLRKQDPVEAMDSYRNAIDLNPDYLDKKTEFFQGKKIKATVLEAKTIIEDDLQADPGSRELKEKRKTVYYMLRRIAGSCG